MKSIALKRLQHLQSVMVGLVIATALLPSCHTKAHNDAVNAASTAGEDGVVADGSALLGSYVGSFGDNKITIVISQLKGDTVEGRSVVGGNDRPFAGWISRKMECSMWWPQSRVATPMMVFSNLQ